MKVFRCKHCGNMVSFLQESGVPVVCCGEPMQQIMPGAVDAAIEKHVPVIKAEGSKITVSIGSVVHPMEEKHLIEWIALQTKRGMQRKLLKPGDQPTVVFMLTLDDAPVAAYAYCNLHGLWEAKA